MNFEHYEGINPDQQFDRLGKKEDLNFLSKKSPEDLNNKNDKTEKLSYKEERIESLKAKIAELKETIRVSGEEEERLSPGFLQEKALELKDKEVELNALEAKSQSGDKKDLVDKDLQASLN
jgi:hypothetical protein